jgi:hypothetical protein
MLDDIFFTVSLLRVLSIARIQNFLTKCLACSTPSNDSLPVAPWEALEVDIGSGYQLLQDINGGPPEGALSTVPAASTTEVGDDVDGGALGRRCRRVRQRPPPRLEMTMMAGPWGALPASPTVSTTEVGDDVDCGPPGGRVRQHPPSSLKATSMAGPLGGAVGGFGSVHLRG